MILGVGVDLVEVSRMQRALDRFGQRLLLRVFHPSEVGYCGNRRDRAACLAATFAAKEAFLKALRIGLTRGIRWLDMEVVRGADRAPELRLGGQSRLILEEQGGQRCLVSISHEGGFGMAMVVIEGTWPDKYSGQGAV